MNELSAERAHSRSVVMFITLKTTSAQTNQRCFYNFNIYTVTNSKYTNIQSKERRENSKIANNIA